MAILGLSAVSGRLRCADDDTCVRSRLTHALATLPASAPVVIMLHGFRYHPDIPRADPHRLIFALNPERFDTKTCSWPEGLGFEGDAGLAIGFGWDAVPEDLAILPDWTAIPLIYDRAARAGAALARALNMISEIDPVRRVDILAHSMGARVAMSALSKIRAPVLGRVILMGAAEYTSEVTRALAANRANRQAVFFNVIARENDLYDLMFETATPRSVKRDTALGAGCQMGARWLDIQIDNARTLDVLATRGISIATPSGWSSHWGFYMRPGMWSLYAGLIRRRWELADLRRDLAEITPDPRWSRLMRRPWPWPAAAAPARQSAAQTQ